MIIWKIVMMWREEIGRLRSRERSTSSDGDDIYSVLFKMVWGGRGGLG